MQGHLLFTPRPDKHTLWVMSGQVGGRCLPGPVAGSLPKHTTIVRLLIGWLLGKLLIGWRLLPGNRLLNSRGDVHIIIQEVESAP